MPAESPIHASSCAVPGQVLTEEPDALSEALADAIAYQLDDARHQHLERNLDVRSDCVCSYGCLGDLVSPPALCIDH